MLAAFVAAVISGSIGSGGGLLLLPILSAILGPKTAVPMLTAVQIVSNASRASFSFRLIRWRALLVFATTAIPCTLLGGFAFAHLDNSLIMRLIGLLLLVYLAIHIFKRNDGFESQQSKKAFLPFAGSAGFLSGMIGTAGPLGPAAFLSLNLSPLEFIATDATCSLTLHMVKLGVYQSCLKIPSSVWGLSLILAVVTIAGSWCGKRFAQRVPRNAFRRVVLGSLAVSSILLLVRL